MLFGLFVCALGVSLNISANIGLSPMNAFYIGISSTIGVSLGVVMQIFGAVILIFDFAMGEKIGIGTVCNTFLVGPMIDIILSLNIIPRATDYVVGILILVISQFTISLGLYLYISTGFGGGPIDSLITALRKRLMKIPVGVIRSTVEGAMLLVGWILAANVGLGTLISVVTIGISVQIVFKLVKFEISSVKHESIIETLRSVKKCNKS